MLGHILVIDDDIKICSLLKQYLNKHKYSVTITHTTTDAEKLLQHQSFDLMVIDVLMPTENGTSFLKRINLSMPVIMLSALGDINNRIEGLESGADDYISKPFDPKELLLRISKLLKRSTPSGMVKFGDFTFDITLGTLLYKDEQAIDLTPLERQIMRKLAINGNKVVHKSTLGLGANSLSRAIDTQIARLRWKINSHNQKPYIQTVRCQGYMLCCKAI